MEAFRAQAAEVREHPLFSAAGYTFSFRMRVLCEGGARSAFPSATRDQQRYLASLLRPFLSQSDLSSFNQCFGVFGRVCTDQILRQGLSDVRKDYERAKNSVLFAATARWRRGEPPPVRAYRDWEIGEAMRYGDGLIHMNPEPRRLLRSLEGPGSQEWNNQAVMRLFHTTGTTALRVDDLLHIALEQGALHT
ncbi:hypothetical protein [Umezawaea beigongshangensis]|uniref:hypothetical protein n=1 Tax=Umezawaea beigongshangensis TaxID=2780383 RepID=UPI0018F2128F|nr:hypothetical protein [Umezawaea beigongshangensis]